MIKVKKPFRVFLDSDGPCANFEKAMNAAGMKAKEFKMIPGIYMGLEVTPGADKAIKTLLDLQARKKIDVWVCTKTPDNAPWSHSEKAYWWQAKFPALANKLIITHDKSLVGSQGDVIIDDRPHKGNLQAFKGTVLVFQNNDPEVSWERHIQHIFNRVADL